VQGHGIQFLSIIKAEKQTKELFEMPWGAKTVEKIREEFVLAAKNGTNFSAICRKFGITRKTGYKWISRASVDEPASDRFINRSTAPKNVSNKTPAEIEAMIIECREENPAWGGKTIRKVLENAGCDILPCVKTCNNILKRNGYIDPAESLKHKPCQRFEREKCNELWQTDFKGDFGLLDGSRCFPLTILDDHSRFSILIDAKPDTYGVKDSFKLAFSNYGMPDSILSDNGSQFSGFRGGYTGFERWLMDYNILPIHGRIMHPQTQGKIERFHRTMKQELLKHHMFADLADVDMHLQTWRRKYNEIRPHEALGLKAPAQVYVPSSRVYRDTPDKFEYSGLFPVRKVNNWGYLRFEPIRLYLSETMADTYLEIRPAEDRNSFIVCYRNFKIAEIDASTKKLINRKISRL
jgi:transposase InsO family protein